MKFIISSSNLLKNLNAIYGVITTNPVLPVLENFLFELSEGMLKVTASDLQTTISVDIEIDSNENGSVAIPAKTLIDTLRGLPEQPLSFNIDDNSFNISLNTDNGQYKLLGENPQDFPQKHKLSNINSIEINSGTLVDAISYTLPATGVDEIKINLTGVLFELGEDNIKFVGTDGMKLVRYIRKDITSKMEIGLIVPRKALNYVKNIAQADTTLNITIEYDTTYIIFNMDNIKLFSRLIEERFPAYENVISKENLIIGKLKLKRIDLLSTLKRVIIYANKITYQVSLEISEKELVIKAEDDKYSNQAVERIACEYEGNEKNMTVYYPGQTLYNLISNLKSENIYINFAADNETIKPSLILPIEKGDEEDILMLLSPSNPIQSQNF